MKKDIYIRPRVKTLSLRPEPLMDGVGDGGLIEGSIPEDTPSEEAANEGLFEEDTYWVTKDRKIWE